MRKSIPLAIQCRNNLCRVCFVDADLGSFSHGNASVPLYPSVSKRCLQCDHASGTASFYQGPEGVIVTRPVLQIKNSCISNDWIICKTFESNFQMFQSNRSPILCWRKGTAGLPVPLFLEQFEQEQSFYLPQETVLNLLITSGFRWSKANRFGKMFDLTCIWKLRLGVHVDSIYFKISILCFLHSFKWMESFELQGSSVTPYLK